MSRRWHSHLLFISHRDRYEKDIKARLPAKSSKGKRRRFSNLLHGRTALRFEVRKFESSKVRTRPISTKIKTRLIEPQRYSNSLKPTDNPQAKKYKRLKTGNDMHLDEYTSELIRNRRYIGSPYTDAQRKTTTTKDTNSTRKMIKIVIKYCLILKEKEQLWKKYHLCQNLQFCGI